MGCDIHLHIEVKLEGRWEHYGAPSMERNYPLFELLAGVRGDVRNAISPPKGLPSDMTNVTKFDCNERWGLDGHSHSWVSAKEISEIEKMAQARSIHVPVGKEWGGRWEWETATNSYLFGNGYAGFVDYPSDNIPGLEDLRFVFWFDN